MIKRLFIYLVLTTLVLLMGFLSSCTHNDSDIRSENEEITISLRIAQSGNMRGTSHAIPGGTPVNFNSGHLYLVTSGGIVIRYYQVVSGDDTATNFNTTPATIGCAHLSSPGGVTIPSVPGNVAEVVVVGNTSLTTPPHLANVNSTIVGARLIDVINQYDADNVNLFGRDELIYAGSNNPSNGNRIYRGNVELIPTVARIEIPNIRARGEIESFTLEGIFIDKHFRQAQVNGGISTDAGNFINVTAAGTNASRFTCHTENTSLYDFDTMHAFHDWHTGGLPSNTITVGENTLEMVSPGSSNVWSYQTFAENHDMSKASTPFPHVILRLSHVKFTDGTEVNEPRFVVVSGFATPSGMPNAMFAGRIYSTGDNLVFDERHIVVDPNLNIITLQINVELHLWYGITTIPETPFTQPNPRHVTITLDESTHTFDLIGAMGGAWENNTYRWEMRRDGETTWIPVGTERTLTTPPLTEDTWFRRVAIASPTNIITSNEALVTVRDGVRLGGIIWAKSNVDMPGTFAVNPEDFGMYYKWNSRMGWSSTDPMVNSNGGTVWDSSTSPPGTDWDTANDPCPDGWRMPTQNEFAYFVGTAALGENPWWVEDWNGTGANGSLIGVAPNQIFLPAAGLRAQGTGGGLLDGENSSAIYWGGTYGGNNSGTLLVGPSIIWFIPTFEHIGHAYPIRCVADIIL